MIYQLVSSRELCRLRRDLDRLVILVIIRITSKDIIYILVVIRLVILIKEIKDLKVIPLIRKETKI